MGGRPPGPASHGLLGDLPQFRRDPLAFFTHLADTYGDVARYRVAHLTPYLLSSPESIESVLVNQPERFHKGRAFRAGRALVGNGLLTSEGEDWRRQRQLIQPAFHAQRVGSYSATITALGQEFIEGWDEGGTRDVARDLGGLTLRIAAATLFGVRLDVQVGEARQALRVFLEEFRNQVDGASLLPDWVPTRGRLRLGTAVRRLERLLTDILAAHRASPGAEDTLLARLLAARDTSGQGLSERQLRDEVMTLILAGHETTAVALTWTLYLVAGDPRIQVRLFEEIQAELGDRLPAAEDVERLPLAEKVVKESLRLYPPVWAISRVAAQNCIVGGYSVAAGQSIGMSQWVMHHQVRYFAEPHRFSPDRWTEAFQHSLPRFAYFPFGGGPRACVGASFATMELVLLLAMIVQRFRLSLPAQSDVRLWPSLTLQPRDGLWLHITPR
jgi:cytochrome P450